MGITSRTLVGLIAGLLALSGCADGGPFNLADKLNLGGDDAAPVEAAQAGGRGSETDVEDPEAFYVSAEGLWDGRPSLGGVWVAHPDVQEPERVIIRNPGNGTSVVGALFRREREMPGPELQVSSDAAAELGLVAGTPQELGVTALRREAVAEEPQPVEDGEANVAPAEVTSTPLDAAETASAVTAATETGDEAATDAGDELAEPYVQAGEYRLKWSANLALRKLERAGLPAQLRDSRTDEGRRQWRVLAGPAVTTQERTALLDRVRAEGFDDAVPVTN